MCSLSAAQLSGTNGRFFRGLFWWIALATSSLPVPVSPWISTVASVGAIRCSRVDDVVHLRAVADDALEAEPLVQPAVQLGVRPPQVLAAGRVLDHRPQLLQIERLEQIVERPPLHRLDGRLDTRRIRYSTHHR